MANFTGYELFPQKTIKCSDNTNLTIEFTFRSLHALEKKKNGNIAEIFAIFEGDLKPSDMMMALWACSLTHHEEMRNLTDEDIEDKFVDKISSANFLQIKLSLIEVFTAFWQEAQKTNTLDPKYQKVLDEMEQQNKKKTKK